MRVVALIPLRGGSKSIPKKNIKPLGGRPLCDWVIGAACESGAIEGVYVSTDCAEIAAVVGGLGRAVTVVDRPAAFATDEASTESVMEHFASVVDFDVLVTIQATSPLLDGRTLERALRTYSAGSFDSMLSAVRTKRFFWTDDGQPINYEPRTRPRRQDFRGTLMENGAFYITSRTVLTTERCRLGGKIGIWEMSEETAVELDEPEDWRLIERLLSQRRQ